MKAKEELVKVEKRAKEKDHGRIHSFHGLRRRKSLGGGGLPHIKRVLC